MGFRLPPPAPSPDDHGLRPNFGRRALSRYDRLRRAFKRHAGCAPEAVFALPAYLGSDPDYAGRDLVSHQGSSRASRVIAAFGVLLRTHGWRWRCALDLADHCLAREIGADDEGSHCCSLGDEECRSANRFAKPTLCEPLMMSHPMPRARAMGAIVNKRKGFSQTKTATSMRPASTAKSRGENLRI